MPCYLNIRGEFDPDAVAASVAIPVEDTWRAGAPSRRGRVHEHSGLQLSASEADFHDHETQFAEAERFLRAHKEAIASITCRAETLESVLDFGLAQSPHPGYFRRIPASLVQIAAELRLAIELSFYACSGDEPSSEFVRQATPTA
jgi:hypothetical protein